MYLQLFICGALVAMAAGKLQCRCDQLQNCMDQEFSRMDNCAKSQNCLQILGGRQNEVAQCVQTKAQSMRTMRDCMFQKAGGIQGAKGCTNSPTPTQIPDSPMSDMNSLGEDMPGTLGQFMQCVKQCVTSGSAAVGRRRKRSANCAQTLNCSINKLGINVLGLITARTQCAQNEEAEIQGHCQCLTNAGANVDCTQLGMYVQSKKSGLGQLLGGLNQNGGSGGNQNPFGGSFGSRPGGSNAPNPFQPNGNGNSNPFNPFGNGQNPFGNGQNPFGNGQNPLGNGQNSFGNGQNLFGNGQNPFGNGQNPFGNGQNPFGGGQNPFGNGQNPFGGGQNPFGNGQNPFGNGQNPFGIGQNPFGSGNTGNPQIPQIPQLPKQPPPPPPPFQPFGSGNTNFNPFQPQNGGSSIFNPFGANNGQNNPAFG